MTTTTLGFFLLIFIGLPQLGFGQDSLYSSGSLKKLTVEELMDIEVTLVSRQPLKLSQAPSAIQVITGEDIRRSTATNIPEALRLASNLQVAQLNASTWIISARGFNTIFANKLLVMIDGRTIYTPFFGGVLWEMHHILLEDVDRIEIISGPGGTLWGANAVNGVINIISKKSNETTGMYAAASVGTFVRDQFELRFGNTANQKLSYRLYGQHFDRAATLLPNGNKNPDSWRLSKGGLHMDINPTAKDHYFIQGEYYGGTRKTAGNNSDLNGEHLIARWTRNISIKSELQVQAYYDRYLREDEGSKSIDEMRSFDLDVQYSVSLSKKHQLLTGAKGRIVKDHVTTNTTNSGVLPPHRDLNRFNVFLQDEISITDKLKLALGTKVMHNVFTGFEWAPSARVSYDLRSNHFLWSAVSRGIRTPSRLDVDYYLPTYPVPPPGASVAGGPNFESEDLLAFEAGYRLQFASTNSFSLAGFYNLYHDVYSVEPLPGTLTYQIQNGSKGRTWGAEFAGTILVTDVWRIRAGYTFFDKKLEAKAGHDFDPNYLANDAKNQVMLHSILDLPFKLQFDITSRYLDYLPATLATVRVPAYLTFDARLAWVSKYIELSVAGQNLADKNHQEFGQLKIPRSVYAKLAFRF